MYPLSDKDLDRLSREAAEQTDVDQSPSGWEKLEHRLNKELPQEKDRRRFLWIFFLLLLLTGGGLTWLLSQPQSNQLSKTNNSKDAEKTVVPLSGNNTTTPDNNRESTVADNNNDIDKQNTNKSNQNTTADNDSQNQKTDDAVGNSDKIVVDVNKRSAGKTSLAPVVASRKYSSPGKTYSNKSFSNDISGSIVANKNRRTKNKNPKSTNDLSVIVPDQMQAQQGAANKADDSDKQDLVNTVQPTASVTTKDDRVDSVKKSDNKIADNKVDEPKPETEKKEKQQTPSSNKNRLSIGLVTGLDYSRISETVKNKAGYSAGLQLSYNITKRFSVNTGFIFTKKFYKAAGNDFHPPQHYFTYYVDKLNWVDGDCHMWDIPLNLRYDFLSKPDTKWFINSGVSTYVMRKQGYVYDYIQNGNPKQSEWKTSSQHNNWFRILNISAGLEKNISKSMTLQAEPYVKVPLSGIGFGKMDLNSYGIFLSIKYRPQFKK